MVLTSIVGFISGALPSVFELFRNRQDNKQELAVMQLQSKIAEGDRQSKFDLSLLDIDLESHTNALASDNQAGAYSANTWVGKFLFDQVAVWRAAIRPFVATSLILFFYWVKYKIVMSAMPMVEHWTTSELAELGIWTVADMELLLLVICYYFGKRSSDKWLNRA